MLTLAQLSADPTWPLAVGAFIIIALFLLGGSLMGVKLWKELKGDPEPKHSPGIDVKIRDEVSASEKRVGNVIGTVKAELREDQRQHRDEVCKEVNQIHGRVSGLRDEIKADYKGIETKVTDSLDKMQGMYATTCERVGKCETDNAHQERTIIAQGHKLDRHIEKH